MTILCTEDDKLFEQYKNKVSDRKIRFHIKYIFLDHWNGFLNKIPTLNIREIIF